MTSKTYTIVLTGNLPHHFHWPTGQNLLRSPDSLDSRDYETLEDALEEKVSTKYAGWDITKVVATNRKQMWCDLTGDWVRYTLKVTVRLYTPSEMDS